MTRPGTGIGSSIWANGTTRNWGQPDAVYGYLPFGGISMHAWAYLWGGDARQYQVIQTDAEAKLLAGEVAAGPLQADMKTRTDAQLWETYERFKDFRLVRDTLCA